MLLKVWNESTVSLIAALLTQLLWIRDTLQLKEDQFASKVEIAMQSVVNIVKMRHPKCYRSTKFCNCNWY